MNLNYFSLNVCASENELFVIFFVITFTTFLLLYIFLLLNLYAKVENLIYFIEISFNFIISEGLIIGSSP